MPELPEIETVRLQLQKAIVGETLEGYVIYSPRSVHGELEKFKDQKVTGIRRLAKVLLIDFTNDLTIAFHFKMTGQLILEKNEDGTVSKDRIVGGHPTEDFVRKLPSIHTRVVFKFGKGSLYFNDQRLFGWVKVGTTQEISQMAFLQKLGPEPFDITSEEFISRVGKKKKPIKLVIMDQEVIAGVGNIYANDALWEAMIYPKTLANHLSNEQLDTLFQKTKLVLQEGIKHGGATSSDYVNLEGVGGHYQDHFRTYGKTGQPCKRCKTKIVKMEIGGRGTFYCPQCQVG
jgi:formamidopyrimidine-DNA glycosylase